jgi:hypothetical protein
MPRFNRKDASPLRPDPADSPLQHTLTRAAHAGHPRADAYRAAILQRLADATPLTLTPAEQQQIVQHLLEDPHTLALFDTVFAAAAHRTPRRAG